MAKRTLQENINQVINDLNEIKSAIETKGVEVPAGTPTRDYGDKILEIEGGIDTSADTVTPESLRAGFTAHDAQGRQIEGVILTYDNTMVTAPSKENFFGKWYFNETIDLSIVSGKMILEFSRPFVYGDTHNAGQIRLNEKGSPLNPYSYATIDYVDGTIFKVYGASGGWDHEGYRNVDFGTTPFEIDETWYEFFTANATYVGNIMALNTAKKYCENNIDVSPIYNEGIAAGINSIPRYEGSIMSGATPGAQAKYEEGYADGQASMPDLSKDTVTPDKLVLGETAHDASGAQITGTLDTDVIRAEGIEAGKKSEYDVFWDAYQENGARKNYLSAFAGTGWSRLNVFPKYNMNVENAIEMFFHHAENYGGHYDLVEHLEKQGIDLDFSQCSNYYSAFAYACIRRIGVVNFSSIKDGSYALGNAFIGSYIVTIDKIIVSEETAFANSTFQNCKKLSDLTIEGTIGQNGFDVSWSPLSKASLISIVNALSSTTTGLTVTLRLDAVNTAFETTAGAADGSTSEEWLALAATKPNWTINLINS